MEGNANNAASSRLLDYPSEALLLRSQTLRPCESCILEWTDTREKQMNNRLVLTCQKLLEM